MRRTVNASVSDGVACVLGHGDVRQRVGPVGRAVLQCQLARRLEQHVHDDPLGRRQHDVLDELLALAAPAVAADELHARSGQRDLEHAGVGGVRQIQAHDLAGLGGQREFGLPGDQQDVAEAPHRGVGRLVGAERRHLTVLDEDVVERQRELTVDRRPVVGVRRDDDDVAVQPHLLVVVLADVRVVPVDAWVGERDARRVAPADRNGLLGLVRAVEAVLQTQPVPVDGRLHVALVLDVDKQLRPLGNPQGRAGDGAVVGEHPDRRVADALGHRRDAQREAVTVGELDGRSGGRRRQAGRLARELVCRSGHPVSLLVSGRGEAQSAKHSSGGRPRRAVRRGRWSWARGRPFADPTPARGGGASSATRLGAHRWPPRLRHVGPMRPGTRDRAEDGRDQRRLGLVGSAPARRAVPRCRRG